VYVWHSVLKRKGEDGVEIDALFGLVRTVDQEHCADDHFKGPGMNKKCHQQLMFSSDHPFEFSTGIALLNFYVVE
jgi:hypothetical protein